MQVNDIVIHDVHGFGLVLSIQSYEFEVLFKGGRGRIHPARLKLAYAAADMARHLQPKHLAPCHVLWLRATDPVIRSGAAGFLAEITSDESVVKLARAVESLPSPSRKVAIRSLDSARSGLGLTSWVDSVAAAKERLEMQRRLEADAQEAKRRGAIAASERTRELNTQRAEEEVTRRRERLALAAQLDAARREEARTAAARRWEREELERLVQERDTGDLPKELHRRLLNHARRLRGDPELDSLEVKQVLDQMARVKFRDSWCWACKRPVSTLLNESCRICGWLVCWFCGSCESHRNARGDLDRVCRATAWAQVDSMHPLDQDVDGVPILTPQAPSADADAIADLLRRAGIRTMYHWSPSRSARSILDHGVLSPADLERRRIRFVPHGYGSVDKARLLWGYVALSFLPKIQMMASWSEAPVVFEVCADVLLTSGAIFVPGNSASAQFAGPAIAGMTGVRSAGELLGPAMAGRPSQSEVWVPRRVPRAAITRVLLDDDTARAQLVAWLEHHPLDPMPEVGPLSAMDSA